MHPTNMACLRFGRLQAPPLISILFKLPTLVALSYINTTGASGRYLFNKKPTQTAFEILRKLCCNNAQSPQSIRSLQLGRLTTTRLHRQTVRFAETRCEEFPVIDLKNEKAFDDILNLTRRLRRERYGITSVDFIEAINNLNMSKHIWRVWTTDSGETEALETAATVTHDEILDASMSIRSISRKSKPALQIELPFSKLPELNEDATRLRFIHQLLTENPDCQVKSVLKIISSDSQPDVENAYSVFDQFPTSETKATSFFIQLLLLDKQNRSFEKLGHYGDLRFLEPRVRAEFERMAKKEIANAEKRYKKSIAIKADRQQRGTYRDTDWLSVNSTIASDDGASFDGDAEFYLRPDIRQLMMGSKHRASIEKWNDTVLTYKPWISEEPTEDELIHFEQELTDEGDDFEYDAPSDGYWDSLTVENKEELDRQTFVTEGSAGCSTISLSSLASSDMSGPSENDEDDADEDQDALPEDFVPGKYMVDSGYRTSSEKAAAKFHDSDEPVHMPGVETAPKDKELLEILSASGVVY